MKRKTGFTSIMAIALPVLAVFYSQSIAVMNTNGQLGVGRALSAHTLGKGILNLGAGIHFGQSNDYMKGPVINGEIEPIEKDGTIINESNFDAARRLSSNLFVGIGLLSFWDIAFSLPFYYDWSGIQDVRDGGLGDLEYSTKLTIPALKNVYHQAFQISGTIPLGMKNGIFPRHTFYQVSTKESQIAQFYTASDATLQGKLLLSFDFRDLNPDVKFLIHLNAGGVLFLSEQQDRNTVTGSFALEYTPVHFLTLFADLSTEMRARGMTTEFNPRNNPIYLTPGIKIQTPGGLFLSVNGDFSLSSKSDGSRLNWRPDDGTAKGYYYSTNVIPNYGVQMVLGWSGFITMQDDDKDGLKNDEDRCPKDAEDIDGFEDADGCPDLDNDNDGIPDLKDKCPGESEDKDGFDDEDGCPDLDNDNDGIPDLKDQCPGLAEDFDGFEDRDGCPDPDNDKDGVADSLDKCPNDPEDFDSFQDTDGCPDLDNDKDGIPDLKDRCPNEPEVFNGISDDDGCPDTVKKEPDMPKTQIIHGVAFPSGKTEMSFESYQYLQPVIKQLKQYPEVEIEVRGHTDSAGDYGKNMMLSQRRADAVRQYLISQGIAGDRIKATGFGSSSPIADNRSAAGRAQNRRIEVVRVK
ncbi:MAG TPA: OmpA family protein [Chitinispirillaceae bacterium]|nr:OmpA family protein [Chitinispirillaceae bacterium]